MLPGADVNLRRPAGLPYWDRRTIPAIAQRPARAFNRVRGEPAAPARPEVLAEENHGATYILRATTRVVTAEIMDANMKEADRWLRQGERDLVSARNSCRSGDFEWACFQAQQSAQKALLYAQGFRRILTHSVYELIREVARIRARVPGAEERSEGTR